MYKGKDRGSRETDKAFALATLMLNVLVLMVLSATIWMVQTLFTQSGSFGVFLNEIGGR